MTISTAELDKLGETLALIGRKLDAATQRRAVVWEIIEASRHNEPGRKLSTDDYIVEKIKLGNIDGEIRDLTGRQSFVARYYHALFNTWYEEREARASIKKRSAPTKAPRARPLRQDRKNGFDRRRSRASPQGHFNMSDDATDDRRILARDTPHISAREFHAEVRPGLDPLWRRLARLRRRRRRVSDDRRQASQKRRAQISYRCANQGGEGPQKCSRHRADAVQPEDGRESEEVAKQVELLNFVARNRIKNSRLP